MPLNFIVFDSTHSVAVGFARHQHIRLVELAGDRGSHPAVTGSGGGSGAAGPLDAGADGGAVGGVSGVRAVSANHGDV